MTRAYNPDYVLITAIIALITFGIVIMASVSPALSLKKFNTPYYYFNHQLLYGLLPGIILGYIAFKTPLEKLKKWAPALFLLNTVALIFIFVESTGVASGGASRWLSLGPLSFQPSEFLKLSFLLYLAAWLSKSGKKHLSQYSATRKFRGHSLLWGLSQDLFTKFIPFLILVAIVGILLILQPDISTLAIIFLTSAAMYFISQTPLVHTFILVSGALGGLLFLITMAPYRLNRFLVFMSPNIDPMGLGYQIKQALIAVGSGGIFGRGLGESLQRFGFLPHPMSDSIFAVLAEETGFLGSLILLILFALFLTRGVEIANKNHDQFSKLTSMGICFWITMQAFINIASMIGLLPLSGIPLPFISYGGSALVAQLIGVGILLNISRFSHNL